MSYVYMQTEPGLWTVGFEDSNGQWHADSDHSRQEEAATRVAYLNGNAAGMRDWMEMVTVAMKKHGELLERLVEADEKK